ncbi:MAG TPA: hypothetical protein VFH31_20775 [Pyrinomonadaceae bacterium]|nr:hypothetical protein [Pyrinomonadaceae bacterium]
MKTNWLKKRIVFSMLALSLLVGIGMTSSATVQAQWPNDSWQRQRDYEREQRRRQREWEREQRRRQRDGDWRDRDDDWRYRDDYRFGGSYQLRQTALNAGYNEGIKEGRRDRDRGERFEYRDEEDYRNANTDYSSRLGNRELYRQYFRQGFANGYRDGYRGY